ncbi:DMT family transporter [Brevibacterium daeguense]
MRRWLFLTIAIVAEVTGSLSLSAAVDFPIFYGLVVVAYLIAFFFLALTMREGTPIGVAYGIWGALGVTLTAIMGAVLFGDPLTDTMLIGIVLVIAGVLAVELGSGQAAKQSAAREQYDRHKQHEPGEHEPGQYEPGEHHEQHLHEREGSLE